MRWRAAVSSCSRLAFLDEGGVDRLLQVVFPVIEGGGDFGRDRVADFCAAPGAWLWRAPRARPAGRPTAPARPPHPAASNTPCISCRFRKGSDRCFRAWPSGSSTFCRENASLYAALLADARFHDLLLAVDRDLAELAEPRAAPVAVAGTWRATPASRAAGRAVSGPSTTSASAFAAPSPAAVCGRRRRRRASSGASSMSRLSSC
jgi:hypothetical protein